MGRQELQPRAFSVMPLVYTIGAIFGPVRDNAATHAPTHAPTLTVPDAGRGAVEPPSRGSPPAAWYQVL